MASRIEFAPGVEKQLDRAGPENARRILRFLRDRVAAADDPRTLGKPLKGKFSELWRYRAGDFRILCEIDVRKPLVLVLHIGHRREIYRQAR